MIGDIFVGVLLVISGCINLLAIGAFWVTPSLRTTANRFVINLLLVNFISCLILSPFAFNVRENSPSTTIASSFAEHNDSILAADVGKVGNNVSVNSTTVECSNQMRECLEVSIKIVESWQNKSSKDELSGHVRDSKVERIESLLLKKYQTWSLDLVVALSVLSVFLVVMDTFIAVTDPLRYHSRISEVKAWLLIAFCWVFGVSFGVASALRTHDEELFISRNFHEYTDNNVYNMMFLLTYFLLVIVTPCLLVSLMYWRIYSEARISGRRMRQNGSSPLLQSALNLAATATAHQQQSTILTSPQCLLLVTSSPQTNKHNTLSKQQMSDNSYFHQSNQLYSDGLTMKIDKQDYYGVGSNNNASNNINHQINLNNHLSYVNNGAFNDTKTFLLSSPPHELMPMLSTIDETTSSTTPTAPKSQQHQNILLTLTTACEQTIKRNHSAKHLLTEANMFDELTQLELRQVRSTPNLRRMSEESTMMSHHQEQTLELPSVQASPKALRYMTSLRHRLSNASSLFKYREEGRAARISILGEFSVLNVLNFLTLFIILPSSSSLSPIAVDANKLNGK